MKTAIVYGTRYGATADTSDRIAEVLRRKGLEVDVINLEEEKVGDLSDYGSVLVGSGIKMSKWTKQAEKFIKQYRKELEGKQVALFVSAGSWPVEVRKGNDDKKEEAYQMYLVQKAEDYSLNPVSMGLFGGIIDFDKMGWITRKFLSGIKEDLEEVGFEEKGTAYDTRDLQEIERWAEDLAEKLR